MQRSEYNADCLSRAKTGQSFANYAAIIQGFAERGIPVADIRPRENVFTFNVWRALGRIVKRGEKGVKITTFVTNQVKREKGSEEITLEPLARRVAKTVAVFHITQTQAA